MIIMSNLNSGSIDNNFINKLRLNIFTINILIMTIILSKTKVYDSYYS
jgi:hypothetical protein